MTQVGLADQHHLVDGEQFGVRTLGARLDNPHSPNTDSLALDDPGGTYANLQARVVGGHHRLDSQTDFVVASLVEMKRDHRRADQTDQPAPLEAEPAEIDQSDENG
jgi:hypothetical protein